MSHGFPARKRARISWLLAVALVGATLAAGSGPALATAPFSIIDNGTVQLGVHAEGHLNVPGGDPSSGTGTTDVGLRYLPTGAEATSPGCLCEGWGAADATSGVSGYANEAIDGVVNMVVTAGPTATADSVITEVEIGDFDSEGPSILRVTHDFHPSATPFLFEVDVTIENISGEPVVPRYRRVMDWDIEPTAFDEFVTIQGTAAATNVLFASDDGFQTANPLGGQTSIDFTGDAVDNGPNDHGALFDFGFDELAPGESMSFQIFYGAAGTETDALGALAAVGAEVYSFGQPNTVDGPTLGTPNTFIFAFAGVGGEPIGEGVDLSVDKTDDIDAGYGPDPVNTNGLVAYGVTVANNGDEPATEVSLTDTPTNGTVFDAFGVGWSCSVAEDGSYATCDLDGELGPDEAAAPVTVLVATPSEAGTIDNEVTVSSAEADANPENNTDTESTTVAPNAGGGAVIVPPGGATFATGGETSPDDPIVVEVDFGEGDGDAVAIVAEVGENPFRDAGVENGAFVGGFFYLVFGDPGRILDIHVKCHVSFCPLILDDKGKYDEAADLAVTVYKLDEFGELITLPVCPKKGEKINCVKKVKRTGNPGKMKGKLDLDWQVLLPAADPKLGGFR